MQQRNSLILSRPVIILITVALLLRIGAIVIMKSYVNPHAWEYGEIAENIVAGRGFARINEFSNALESTSSHAPLYPYYLALFYNLGRTDLVYFFIQLIQAIMSVLTIMILCNTASILFNKSAAIITAIITTFYPPLIYYSIKLTPATFFVFLTSLAIYLILRMKQNNLYAVVATGAVFGVAILCDPLAFVIFPALFIRLFGCKKIDLWKFIVTAGLAITVLIPWTIRNYSLHHSIVPITTQFGKNLWIGNNPQATGTDYYAVQSVEKGNFVLMTATLPRKVKNVLGKLNETERSKLFLRMAGTFIKENPEQFLKLFVKKCFYYWWFSPPEINGSPDVMKYRTSYALFYLPVLILGFIGIALSLLHKHIKKTLFVILIMVFISGIYIITHVGLLRYRILPETCLLVFTAFTIAYFLKTNILRKFEKR